MWVVHVNDSLTPLKSHGVIKIEDACNDDLEHVFFIHAMICNKEIHLVNLISDTSPYQYSGYFIEISSPLRQL